MRPRQIKSRICGKKPAQSPAGHRLPAADPKMRRRPRLSAAFCLLCFLGMMGCTPGASVDTLLKPPSLSAEQQQIYLALQDAVGSGITLQYPRAGENLSAFTVIDLDADGEEPLIQRVRNSSLVERLCAENLTGLNLTPKLRQYSNVLGRGALYTR